MKISIIGLGFVGSAMYKSFQNKNVNVYAYDKYKLDDKGNKIGDFKSTLNSEIIFLCLPTIFDSEINQYNKAAIYETCQLLVEENYKGTVVIKSTVEPTTTADLSERYNLNFVHNPEFLTASTAYEDFHNQSHIVLGRSKNCTDENYENLFIFYKTYYPDAEISLCTSLESECMKLFCNCFYSVKIQFFTELYLLSKQIGADYDSIVSLMLKNNWIKPNHTKVPGPDGKISYGGLCFPKDTNALLNFMQVNGTSSKVMAAVIEERNEMRDDHLNVKK